MNEEIMSLRKLPVVTRVGGWWGEIPAIHTNSDAFNSASLEDICRYSAAPRSCEQYQLRVGRKHYRIGTPGPVLDEQS